MFEHIGLKVMDLEAAVHFYQAALRPLGCVLIQRDLLRAGFAPEGEVTPWLSLTSGSGGGGGAHITLFAATPNLVCEVYAAALSAGGADVVEPAFRDQVGGGYAACASDPDGNILEAVCPTAMRSESEVQRCCAA